MDATGSKSPKDAQPVDAHVQPIDEQPHGFPKMAEKIWVKKEEEEVEEERHEAYDKFVRAYAKRGFNDFPVSEAMEVVRPSKMSSLERRWREIGEMQMKAYKLRLSLINETLEVVTATRPSED